MSTMHPLRALRRSLRRLHGRGGPAGGTPQAAPARDGGGLGAEHGADSTDGEGVILAVCRGPDQWADLTERLADEPGRIRVASEDLAVQDAARSTAWVDDVVFVEDQDSLFTVESAVSAAIGTINDWFHTVEQRGEDDAAEVLFWRDDPVEGTFSTRVQDAALLVRSYETLLGGDVSRVLFAPGSDPSWEDDLLVDVAAQLGVRVEVCSSPPSRLGSGRITSRSGRAGLRRSLDRGLSGFVAGAKTMARILRAKLRGPRTVRPEPTTVAFQLGTASTKHVENIEGPMHAVDARAGYTAQALCWDAHQGALELQAQGLAAVELKALFPLRRTLGILRRTRRLRKRVLRALPALEGDPGLQYRGIDLLPYLEPVIRDFLATRVFDRLVLGNSLERYVDRARPPAVKLWCAGRDEYGTLTRRVFEPRYDPFWFHYYVGEFGNLRYFRDEVDHYFVSGETDEDALAAAGVDRDRITVRAKPRYEDLATFATTYSPADSRRELGLTGEAFRVFYAPQDTERGSLSRQEKVRLLTALERFAADHPDAAVHVKPHPSGDPELIEEVLGDSYLSNVAVLDPEKLPYHCINAADVVLTKYSTVGFETMLMETLLIAVALNGETRFDNFGDVPERVYDTDDLRALLADIRDNYKAYESEQAARREQFLPRKFPPSDADPTEALVDAILDRLADHGTDTTRPRE